jgi:hypothetical protein
MANMVWLAAVPSLGEEEVEMRAIRLRPSAGSPAGGVKNLALSTQV